MSIRPVDMQLTMPRAVENSTRVATEQNRPVVETQNFQQELRKKTETEQRTVASTYQTEQGKVNEEGRRRQEEQKKKRKRGNDKDKGKEGPARRSIDVSI